MKEYPDNVRAFEEKCDACVADYEREMFDIGNGYYLKDIESPIECLFLLAYRTIVKLNEDRLCNCYSDEGIKAAAVSDIHIFPQYAIGKYRVDFLIKYTEGTSYNGQMMFRSSAVAVELDGHEFHEKDEKQRRYEKARDRFLQKKGLRVFHYTGSEIVKNPFNAAMECIAAVSECGLDRLQYKIAIYGYPEWQNGWTLSGDAK